MNPARTSPDKRLGGSWSHTAHPLGAEELTAGTGFAALLQILQIRLVLVRTRASPTNLGDSGVVQFVLLGRVADGWHRFRYVAVVRLGRNVLIEEADDDSGEDGGD